MSEARIKVKIEEDGAATKTTVGAIEDEVSHDQAEKILKEIVQKLGGGSTVTSDKKHQHAHRETHVHVNADGSKTSHSH